MADLSRHWQKERAIIGSEAEQLRAQAWDAMRAFEEDGGEEWQEALEAFIDQLRKDDRHAVALVGLLAEIGMLHCMLGEIA